MLSQEPRAIYAAPKARSAQAPHRYDPCHPFFQGAPRPHLMLFTERSPMLLQVTSAFFSW